MSVLVTGGTGVVGIHVARRLAEEGKNVVVVSTSGAPKNHDLVIGALSPMVRFETGDILDVPRLEQLVAEQAVEGIIHAAALTGENQARSRTLDVVAINVLGTANVLEVARRAKLKRVVLFGSASEYGRRADLAPIHEEELNPEGLYAESKYLGERLGARFRDIFDLDVVTVRVSSVYGPHTRFNPYRKLVGNTLIAHLCRAAAYAEDVTLEGGGDYPRDWTYAADTARAIALVYAAPVLSRTTYNVAAGRSYVLTDVVEALRRVEPNARVTVGSGEWQDDPFQSLNLRGPLDISRISDELGFAPRYPIEEGLRSYIAWWREVRAREAGGN